MLRLLCLIASVLMSTGSHAQSLNLGEDIPYRYYDDADARLSLDEFLQLPDSALNHANSVISLGYTRSALWISAQLSPTLFSEQDRWLQLAPNFVDHLTLYYRPAGADADEQWRIHEAGDLALGSRGQVDYRFPVYILSGEDAPEGYDVVLRAESSSAVLIQASLWNPAEFAAHAVSETGFWSFYFGLAVLSGALALLMAMVMGKLMYWLIFVFSLNSLLVASVQGFVDWLIGPTSLHIQHYLTGFMTLVAYNTVLWMCIELLGMREHFPRVYRAVVMVLVANALLLLSIPFDFYGLAITIQGVLCVASTIVFTAGVVKLWQREGVSPLTLTLGLSPLVYVCSALLAIASLAGLIPFSDEIYITWQYSLLVNMILVLGLSFLKIRDENRQAVETARLEHDLTVEREATLHQRQFIGMLSHEFRTPLAVMSSTIQNLDLQAVDEQIKSRYGKVHRAINRLTELTDNCLADARLEVSSRGLEIQQADLIRVVHDAAVLVDLSENHTLRLTCGEEIAAPDTEVWVNMDSAMVRIALSNLISNAVKYSSHGTIEVDVSEQAKDIKISVSDQGSGIPADQVNHIFKRYRRGDNALRGSTGSGLGLYVAREIAVNHGGDLRLTRNTPQGCRFEMTLPRRSV